MHRLAATPGGWDPQMDGVVMVDQNPAPLVFLTAADTEIQTLARVLPQLPSDFPALRVASLLNLQQPLAIDDYGDRVLAQAQVVVVRLLGGRAYWSYGLEVLKELADLHSIHLLVLPGDEQPDPELLSHSTVPLAVANQFWRYLTEGGVENLRHGLLWLCDRTLNTTYQPPEPQAVPRVGSYCQASGSACGRSAVGCAWGAADSQLLDQVNQAPVVALLFYRAHFLSGNTAAIEAVCQALTARGMRPLPMFVSSLQDPAVQGELMEWLRPESPSLERPGADLILNTTSFSVAKLNQERPNISLWQDLDLPVLQVIFSGGPQQRWQDSPQGLTPRDMAMNVALPEVDGRIISRAVSFKAVESRSDGLETDVVTYEPAPDRVAFVADLAVNWVRLRRKLPSQRRVALILSNYPARDGRLANGVGLDTPQSCVEILRGLQQAGYLVGDLPGDGDELIQWLTAGVTNDPEGRELRPVHQTLSGEAFGEFFAGLSTAVQAGVGARWGAHLQDSNPDSTFRQQPYPIAGRQIGNIFIGIQPSRGYDQDPGLNYHAPDLQPTPEYFAFYAWVRQQFGADAVVHVGKHGNLEWLPGKSVALSADCYPEAVLGPLPNLYPFIVNDPGEGAQAKRRAQAVVIDHLTPPLTRAELYGPLLNLEALVDEYYEAQSLNPSRLPLICDRILTLLQDTHLNQDLGLAVDAPANATDPEAIQTLLPQLDAYLCDLKEAQIRDGLHIFGRCPQGRQLRDLIVAIARHPSCDRIGLTRALAESWGLDIDPLTDDPATPWQSGAGDPPALAHCRMIGDVVEILEQTAAEIVSDFLTEDQQDNSKLNPQPSTLKPSFWTSPDWHWLTQTLLPNLRQTSDEMRYLLHGLNGGYVPSGPAGAPTRNRPDVLPTGRNFYSVDIRAIPTESAWDVGRKAAEALVERYVQDNGDYPRTLGFSMWGTSTMRTGGDDLAQALALLGVRPVWDGPSRRLVDFEVLPLSLLGRPRVDVTLRISGFFRDAFPNLIDLFDSAVTRVAQLEEPADQNPLAAQVRQETQHWLDQGLDPEQAEVRSQYRIFGSQPGAYGAGLQGLIEAQNWTDDQDLARAYINWSSYAYSRQNSGRPAPDTFRQRLGQMQMVLHNLDNREQDLLDSDDYYQFQGGLTAAVRAVSGQQPATYFGDNANIATPKVRALSEEIAKVYRSRVVNPKWIAGAMRHGYKGAFEMAATVDFLFAYDATAHCVADHMYQGVTEAYLLDPHVQQFIQTKNPAALRDMAERLLEAAQRGLWASADAQVLDQLKAIANQAEGQIESRYP
jgi:cobaltochelatase CobN